MGNSQARMGPDIVVCGLVESPLGMVKLSSRGAGVMLVSGRTGT
jgi:hypothetical protein